MNWTRAKVGCYWYSGEYTIASISGGSGPPTGYTLAFRAKGRLWQQLIGEQLIGAQPFPTLEAAQRAAEEHAARRSTT